MPAPRWFAIESPWTGAATGASGALGVVSAHAPPTDIDALFRTLAWSPVVPGAIGLRALPGAHELIVARPAPNHIICTPVASVRIVEVLTDALGGAGFEPASDADPRDRYPEAATLIDACALESIAWAASPRAIDTILDHRARWSASPAPPLAPAPNPLDHLLTPPIVAAVGRPNVGKSSLLNAMARRSVAIAADEPGTTRDHVGAEVECDGLVVHWIDTPGIPAPGTHPRDALDAESIRRARTVIARADLILVAADGTLGAVDSGELPAGPPILRVETRADLSPTPAPGCAVRTSAVRAEGLDALARAIRNALVPDAALESASRWRFHPALPAE